MAALFLGLDDLKDDRSKKSEHLWVTLTAITNAKFAVDISKKKLLKTVIHDRSVREALTNLKKIKQHITTYGVSESLMAIFNEADELTKVLRLEIPEINSVNQRSVGIACCESIDNVIESTYTIIRNFFDDVVARMKDFFEKIDDKTECQCATITELLDSTVESVEFIDAEEFSTEEIFGYTQPVYMDRLTALKTIINALNTMENTEQSMRSIDTSLKVLGFKIEDKTEKKINTECDGSTTSSDDECIELIIVEETQEEAEASAPPINEVMSPELVVEDDEDKSQSTEDDVVKFVAPEVDCPTDAPQEQQMTVLRWTPENIKTAGKGLLDIFCAYQQLDIRDSFYVTKGKVDEILDNIESLSPEDKQQKLAYIEVCRKYTSYVCDILCLYDVSVNELVDQFVIMCSKLKTAEVEEKDDDAVPVENVTEKQPLGEAMNSFLFDEDGNLSPIGEPSAPVVQPSEPEVEPEEVVTAPVAEPLTTDPEEEPTIPPIEEPIIDPTDPVTVEEPIIDPVTVEEPIIDPVGVEPTISDLLFDTDGIEEPENIPSAAEPLEPAKGVDPNAEAQPGDAVTEPHRPVLVTPEEDQPEEEAEKFLESTEGAFWRNV